jgi:hypothetical protein
VILPTFVPLAYVNQSELALVKKILRLRASLASYPLSSGGGELKNLEFSFNKSQFLRYFDSCHSPTWPLRPNAVFHQDESNYDQKCQFVDFSQKIAIFIALAKAFTKIKNILHAHFNNQFMHVVLSMKRWP